MKMKTGKNGVNMALAYGVGLKKLTQHRCECECHVESLNKAFCQIPLITA